MNGDTYDLFEPPSRLGETFSRDLDGARLYNNTGYVFRLLKDGEPHDLDELRAVGGAQGDRRARDLRDPRYGELPIDCWRDPDAPPHSGRWLYRMAVERMTKAQWDMAVAALSGAEA